MEGWYIVREMGENHDRDDTGKKSRSLDSFPLTLFFSPPCAPCSALPRPGAQPGLVAAAARAPHAERLQPQAIIFFKKAGGPSQASSPAQASWTRMSAALIGETRELKPAIAVPLNPSSSRGVDSRD